MPNAESLSATQDRDIQAKCFKTDFFFEGGGLCYNLKDRYLNERKMIDEQPCKTSARINKWETPFTNPI